MTTILADARLGVMVSDSKATCGDTWVPCTKVHRVGGALIGTAGSEADIQRWLKWWGRGRRGARPDVEDFSALVLNKDGVLHALPGSEMRIERGFHAVGTGGNAALGALMAGADPAEAVRIACLVDANSGGEVQVFRLKETE